MNTALAIIEPPSVELDAPRPGDHRRLANLWLEHLDRETAAGALSPRTAASYARNIEGWLDWLDLEGVTRPSPDTVRTYQAHLMEALRPASVNAYMAAVRCLYAWAESRDIYPAIGRSVKGLKVRKDEPLDCLERTDVARLLALIEGESEGALRDRALVRVMFATALRLVSLVGLNVSDLDTVAGVLRYRAKGDRDKARTAYLPPAALAALKEYMEARGELCPDAPLFAGAGNRSRGERLTDRSMRRIVVGLMERAGHVRRDGDGRLVNPGVFSAHSIRRSAVTSAYDARGLDAAQVLAGHASPETTKRAYARVQKGRMLRELTGVMDLEVTT
jgi:site-specific recombinase XerD